VPYWKSAKRLIQFPHLKKLIDLGGVSISSSYEELTNLINNYLKEPDLKSEERKKSIFLECGDNDGQATNRITKVFEEICK
ncbi:MAG: hypothetical protein AAFP82_07890, partial [Bacteroidota bacterium]